MTTVLVVLTTIALADGCDPAADASYLGEPLVRVHAVAVSDSGAGLLADADFVATLRLAVRWSLAPAAVAAAAPGAGAVVYDDTPILSGASGDFELGIFERPPDTTLRALDHGALALGQLVFYGDLDGDAQRDESEPIYGGSDRLLAFSPDGADDATLLSTPLAAGFTLVEPSAPCDAWPLRLFPPVATQVSVGISRAYDSARLFSTASCGDAWAATADTMLCNDFGLTRWLCRYGPRPSEFCAACEWEAVPLGADDATCQAWAATCRDSYATLDICAHELDVCLFGEPQPTTACDLACACEAYYDWCSENLGVTRDVCMAKAEFCKALLPQPSGPRGR